MRTVQSVLILLALATFWGAGAVHGQQPAGTGAPEAGEAAPPEPAGEPGSQIGAVGPQHVLKLLREGDPTMWALLACSVLAVTFVLDRLIVLRRGRVLPRTFVDRFMDRLRDGELDRTKALELCRDNGSPVANVFALVVQNWGRPATEIRQAVATGAESELFYLKRRIRGLNGIATLAPLLGLFGTVIGMIRAFHALSLHTGAGKTELLAEGISLALIATATGLGVAVFSAAAYYFLLGRVDDLVQQMDRLANEVISYVASEGRGVDKAHVRPRVVPAREPASG